MVVLAASLLAGGTISAAAREAEAASPVGAQTEKTVQAARGAGDLVVSSLSRLPASLERTTGLEVATTVKNLGAGTTLEALNEALTGMQVSYDRIVEVQ